MQFFFPTSRKTPRSSRALPLELDVSGRHDAEYDAYMSLTRPDGISQ